MTAARWQQPPAAWPGCSVSRAHRLHQAAGGGQVPEQVLVVVVRVHAARAPAKSAAPRGPGEPEPASRRGELASAPGGWRRAACVPTSRRVRADPPAQARLRAQVLHKLEVLGQAREVDWGKGGAGVGCGSSAPPLPQLFPPPPTGCSALPRRLHSSQALEPRTVVQDAGDAQRGGARRPRHRQRRLRRRVPPLVQRCLLGTLLQARHQLTRSFCEQRAAVGGAAGAGRAGAAAQRRGQQRQRRNGGWAGRAGRRLLRDAGAQQQPGAQQGSKEHRQPPVDAVLVRGRVLAAAAAAGSQRAAAGGGGRWDSLALHAPAPLLSAAGCWLAVWLGVGRLGERAGEGCYSHVPGM